MSIIGYLYSTPRRIKNQIRRKKALKHVYDYPATSDGWMKNANPILGSAKSGSYFDPYVLSCGSKHYVYISRRKDNTVVRFEITDNMQLKNEVVTLSGVKSSWEEAVNRACVVKVDSAYMMWYTGQFEGKSCIGVASSEDGIHFEKYAGNPVLVPEGRIERNSVMNPCVIFDERDNLYKMWFAAGETYEPDVICYATSQDGIHWDRHSVNPVLQRSNNEYDLKKVGGCDVHFENGQFVMYYIGYHDVDTARICCAVSDDGISWSRIKQNPVVSPSPESWDAHAVYKPAYFRNQSEEYILYNGRVDDLERIGYVKRMRKNAKWHEQQQQNTVD